MDIKVKLVVVGDASVGKTSLLMSYARNEFPEGYVPTVFETFETLQIVDNRNVSLELWDTAGSEDYNSLRSVSYANVDVFMVCFAIDRRESFNNVQTEWLPEVSKHSNESIPIVLVGLKSDLREGESEQNFVSQSDACRLASTMTSLEYLECSAKTRSNIDSVFEKATKAVLLKRYCPTPKKGKKKLCQIL